MFGYGRHLGWRVGSSNTCQLQFLIFFQVLKGKLLYLISMVGFNPFHVTLESKTGRYKIYFNAIELLHVFWLVAVDCQFHGWHAVTKDQILTEPPYWFLCNYILDQKRSMLTFCSENVHLSSWLAMKLLWNISIQFLGIFF